MKDTVLIVDEDVNAGIIAEVLLQSRGLAARLANDGSDACEILKCHGSSITVVVVDLGPAVSGMNGWELLRCMRGRFGGLPLSSPPRIVAVSRQTDAHTERFARRLGADAFLPKPLVPSDFINTVVGLLAPSSIRARLVGTTAVAGGTSRARRNPWNDAAPKERGA